MEVLGLHLCSGLGGMVVKPLVLRLIGSSPHLAIGLGGLVVKLSVLMLLDIVTPF